MKHEPVIVFGMHRSGTTLLVRLLEKFGFFMGHDQDPNAEARFFMRLNHAMLKFAGARWDQPDAFLQLLKDEALCEKLSEWLSSKLAGPDTRLYLNRMGWLRWRDVRNYPHPCGWKDPRNTLTLPIWMRLFPGARLIHIVRHGVDVAASLRVREQQLRKETLTHFPNRGRWRMTSPLCLDMEGGFRLWERYVEAGMDAIAVLPKRQCLQLRYEDLLIAPEEQLERLRLFLDVETMPNISGISMNASRAYAFRHDPELQTFTGHIHSPWLARLYPDTP